nr:replication associated protein [Lake Sarah-associated circular virus-12]
MAYNFCFTCNNPTDAIETYIQSITMSDLFGYAHEVGELGTPHLQGVVVLNKKSRLTAVRKILPKCHISQMRGSFAEAWDGYILTPHAKHNKPEPEVVYAFGTPPVVRGSNTRDVYEEAMAIAKTGTTEGISAQMMLRFGKALHEVAQKHSPKPPHIDGDLDNYWIYGPTGSGKSKTVYDKWPRDTLYIKLHNKWWENYDGEETVYIEDLGNDSKLLTHIKHWADRYAFRAEVKFGSILIRPKRLVVTSNHTIRDSFPTASVADVEALERRFKIQYIGPQIPAFTSVTK